ncbi:MAG TPA: hypothetical protein VF365_05800 [Candidatus Limnocylindria bacterium]
MFSRDDYGRGPRFPLAWVFGPLVIGALLITVLGIAARATQGFPNIELADDIRLAAGSGDPLLADVTPFEWDRVCVFPSSVSMDEVDDLLGFEWGVIGGDPNGDRTLLVLVRDQAVVTHFFLARGMVAAPAAGGDCRSPDDESTRL